MKVSVLVVVYNQDGYITQAIESILGQEVGFAYEIVIGEDASTDNTREIVLAFQDRYPDRIRVLLHDEVEAKRDRAAGLGGKTNFVRSLQACKGEYIALLDGDDFWTDNRKLQKQVDFLENHPDFAISSHNVTMLYEDDSRAPANLFSSDQKEVSTLEDLLVGNSIQSCSVLFRSRLFAEFPDWFYTLKIGDWPLHIMNAQHGKIRYFPEAMAVYRVHQRGFWSGWSPADRALEVIRMMDYIDAYLGFKHRNRIRNTQAEWYWQLANLCFGQGDHSQTRSYLRRYVRLGGLSTCRKALSLFLQLEMPALYNSLRSLKEFLGSGKSHRPGATGDLKASDYED